MDAQPDAQARTDDPYVQPLLSHEGIASALADFDARTAVWVDKCNANGVTEVLCREDLPVSYYALRGDFLFFLLGFKPACLIGHGSTEVRKLYIDTLLEDVWRPALHALEDAGDVQFEPEMTARRRDALRPLYSPLKPSFLTICFVIDVTEIVFEEDTSCCLVFIVSNGWVTKFAKIQAIDEVRNDVK